MYLLLFYLFVFILFLLLTVVLYSMCKDTTFLGISHKIETKMYFITVKTMWNNVERRIWEWLLYNKKPLCRGFLGGMWQVRFLSNNNSGLHCRSYYYFVVPKNIRIFAVG